MKPDIIIAKKFLKLIAGETLITFQTFNDNKEQAKHNKHTFKKDPLATICHGITDKNLDTLTKLQEKGAGIYFMVNAGDGKGRKKENVTGVRAVFIDLDGEPLPDKWELAPHIVVESSPGRYHAYWIATDCPLDKFTSVQQALAVKFNSDPSVHDLPRVLRVPGFIHQKGEPFMTSIISASDKAPYPFQEIIDVLALNLTEEKNPFQQGKGESNNDYFKGGKEGGRTARVVKMARCLSNRNFSEDESVEVCITLDKLFNQPPLETTHPGKVEHTVRDVYERYVYTDVPEFVTEMNEKHFVVCENGKTSVCKEEYDFQLNRNFLSRSTFSDHKNFYCNRRVSVGTDKKGNPVYMQLGHAWLEAEKRRQYIGIIMAPMIDDPRYYNLWKGFSVKPVKGSWGKMKNHVLKIICGGDEKLFRYVMGWCARMIQQPGTPGEVALVLQGGRGTGKGCFGHALRRLISHHACHITNSKHLTGNFNAHLESCVFLFVDEALWAGDKAGENVLKGLITEAITSIEKKFVDLKQMPNMLHVLMASNNDWVVPAGIDERRYCVLKVSNAMAGNHKYFDELIHETGNGGLEAMLYDLMHWDISDFNVKDFPKTAGLFEQKLQSLDPVQSWWYQKLQNGEIVSSHPWNCVPSEQAHTNYCEITTKMSSQIRRLSDTGFGMALRKLLPEGWPVKKKHKLNSMFEHKRVHHYELPPLDVCRKHFESMIGESITWDVPHHEDTVPPCSEEFDL